MIYVTALLVALAAIGGAYGGYSWEAGRWAQEKVKQEAAQSMIDEQGRELAQETANHEADIATAFEAGQSKARVVYAKIQQRGASDVANNAVFSNRACDWPANVVQLVNSAFANLRAPSDPGVANATVPAPASATGRPTGSSLPLAPLPTGAVEPVRSDARATGGGGEVSGGGSARPPKPTPRGAK